MMRRTYETDRLILTLSCEKLAEAVTGYYARNKEFFAPFDPCHPAEFYTVDYQRKELRKSAEASAQGSEYRYWVSLKEEPEKIIGLVGATGIILGAFRSCFLSYKLDADYLRRGLMSEAVGAFVEALFSDLKLHRVEANILPRNTPSLGVVRKLGFENEGLARAYLRINGVWEDHIHMVKINEEG